MELAVKDKKENRAMGRQELLCEVSFDKAMPSRKQLREAICAATGCSPELLVIVSATGGFGTQKAAIRAHAYQDKAALGVAGRHLLVRDGMAEKKKKEGKKAAAPAKK